MIASKLVMALALAIPALISAQTVPPAIDYVCPMHRDVRSSAPGKCPRCGMTLEPGIPDFIEYGLNVSLTPRAPKAGESVALLFQVRGPRTGAAVTRFETVHEKLFHLFLVSQDLEFFAHVHPVKLSNGSFRYEGKLPKPGMYRVLADYYPANGSPQLTARTIFVAGGTLRPAQLCPPTAASGCTGADRAAKHTENLDVELVTEPTQPIAGMKTMLFFRVKPGDGLEPYLGAWGHLLAASDDLVDLIHTHPFQADGGPQIQFNLIFPRARVYRIWAQFQRNGVVNTAVFTVPVSVLK